MWRLTEIGRVGLTHALDPEPIAAALGVGRVEIATLFASGTLPEAMPRIDGRVASYVLNILVRLEVRCCGDSVAIRAALARPCPDLADASITDAFSAGPDFPRLVTIRALAGTLPLPKVKMWRVADRYS